MPYLTIHGTAGRTVQVQYNPDLNPVRWNVLTNVFQQVNPFTFIDSTATDVATRFYRLALP